MATYDAFTKEELIEMIEKKEQDRKYWRDRTKELRSDFEELFRCFNELWNCGETETVNFKVARKLDDIGFDYDYKSQKHHAPVIIEEETEKKILLRDIMWIMGNGTPMDLCMHGEDESFMSVETPFLNGICLVPEAFLGMEVVGINTTEKESRIFITIK